MKYAMISFSAFGEALSDKIKAELLKESGIEVNAASKFKAADSPLELSLDEWTKNAFDDSDVLIFIGASGIAVRAIAPYVNHKSQDPAVIVMDDRAKHVISLLSGHLGGANEQAVKLAKIVGAEPVITTATDNHGMLSPDVFAKQNNLQIVDLKSAKHLAAAFLKGEQAGLLSELPLRDDAVLPEEVALLKDADEAKAFKSGIFISNKLTSEKELPFETTMQLIPKNIWLGMGCRKGCPYENVKELADAAIEKAGIDRRAVKGVASIDIKKDEEGLKKLAAENGWEFICFSADELLKVPGEFKASDFVKSVTGVDNVCERSAVLASGEGRLILGKTSGNASTIAIAEEKRSINV